VTQVLAEQLCVPPSDIVVGYADTHSGFNGVGPQGSRFTTMITGACVSASYKIKAKLKLLAGHLLEASVDSLELRNGAVGIKGSERQVAIADIAMQANFFRLNFPDKPEFDSGLETTAVYDHPISTLPHPERKHLGVFYPMMGHVCHIAVVEVNPQTGKVSILDYAAVHDNGTIVNPQTLGGQVLGGTANGIGTTLLEEFIYDETGQFLNPNFAEFSLPSAYEMPANLKIGHVETPSPYSEYGVKGGGEGGRLGAPSALTSAMEDALRSYGVKIHTIPVRPSKLRELIRAAQS
jgi:CO/xanthine dehydrogenase Mo-binding subunit